MLGTTYDFIDRFFEKHPKFVGGKVLDVGSLDINGNPKESFEKRGYKYIGVDMLKGNNVDVVMNAHQLTKRFDNGSFDIVFCVDTIEHDEAFWLTLNEIRNVLRRGGYLLLGAPGRAHQQHRHPQDYWRFMEDSFKLVFFKGYKDVNVEVHYHEQSFLNHATENQIYGWGKKT